MCCLFIFELHCSLFKLSLLGRCLCEYIKSVCVCLCNLPKDSKCLVAELFYFPEILLSELRRATAGQISD